MIAVLTGDFIGSTDAGPEALNASMSVLQEAAETMAQTWELSPPRFTRYRGDGWQIAVLPPRHWLRMSVFLLASLRRAEIGVQTRIGIGIGDYNHLGEFDLSDAHGRVFLHAGNALRSATTYGHMMDVSWEGPIHKSQLSSHLWCRSAIDTVAFFAERWSREGAEAVALRVLHQHMTQQDIASCLFVSRQAVASRLTAAGIVPIMAAIHATEESLT